MDKDVGDVAVSQKTSEHQDKSNDHDYVREMCSLLLAHGLMNVAVCQEDQVILGHWLSFQRPGCGQVAPSHLLTLWLRAVFSSGMGS
jgi:hypothetical protein